MGRLVVPEYSRRTAGCDGAGDGAGVGAAFFGGASPISTITHSLVTSL